jgi:hypothetical protein
MSGVNGDKARFHRERKQKLARRKRNRAMLESLLKQPKSASSSSAAKSKPVSA